MNYNNLKEKSTHGNSMFPLHVYTHIDSVGNYSVNSHWHNEVEIIFVEDGEFELIINMESVKLSKGQCICINKGEIHSLKSICNTTSIHHAIVFNLDIISSLKYDFCQINYIEPLMNGSIKFPLIIDNSSVFGREFIGEVLSIITYYNAKSLSYQITIKACFFKILSLLTIHNQFINSSEVLSKSKCYKLDLVKKVFQFVDENYSKKIYIEDLANLVNMNSNYFCRFFKSATGKTPIEYINHLRVEHASKLLITSNDKIMDICFNVGFDNFSYFIKIFKQYKSCTPSQYRKTYFI